LPSGRRHYRITLADALSAHDRALLTGGRAGIHDLDALLSGIGRPYTGYYRSIASKAAALLQSIATNHAFNDGNKRTSIILMDLLLDRSGYRLEPIGTVEDIESALEEFVVERVVKNRASADVIADWLGPRIVRLRKLRA
jgi:death-on-curing protein